MAESDEPKLSREERNFAAQVRLLREESGWSQDELARQMQRAGIEYANQSTVSRIEKATRPVRMIEGQALSRIFRRTVYAMTNPDSREFFLHLFHANHSANRRSYANFKTSIREAAEGQINNTKELAQLLEMFEGADLDPETADRYENLLTNMRQLSDVDLAFEGAQIVAAVRRQENRHNQTGHDG